MCRGYIKTTPLITLHKPYDFWLLCKVTLHKFAVFSFLCKVALHFCCVLRYNINKKGGIA